jgi:VWFA-related protein
MVGGVCGVLIWGASGADDTQPQVSITPRVRQSGARRFTSNLRVDVKVVLVPVSVTDALDRPVHSLAQSNFRVLEDGVEQKISMFSKEDGPVSMGLLFDDSASMRGRIESSLDALKFVFQAALPGDEYFLIEFNDKAHLLCPFLREPEEIMTILGRVKAQGWTALLDAIAMGAHQMRRAQNGRKTLLILSDGNDNNSRFTESEIRNLVMESDLRVYGIGLLTKPKLLQRLAEETGGDVLVVNHMEELPDAVQRLSREIRSEYVLGYASTNGVADAKYRRVKVELVPPSGSPPLRASWRRGYFAPRD